MEVRQAFVFQKKCFAFPRSIYKTPLDLSFLPLTDLEVLGVLLEGSLPSSELLCAARLV